ncbi:MAG: cupin domain-containing protein [Thermoanaerobaculales bacterium]|nr:cupin domain-containing protein [Thermoanaerobaculales bacterium]
MGKRPSRFIHKPWGHEEIFAETNTYLGKLLIIKAGESLSLQYHEQKEETLRVLEGKVLFQTGSKTDLLEDCELGPGDVFHIPPGLLHRMVAITDSVLLEVSTAHIDDVVRLSDRYGREGTIEP